MKKIHTMVFGATCLALFFVSCEEYTLPKDGEWLNESIQAEENAETGDGSFVTIKFNISSGKYSITEGNKIWLEAVVTGDIVRPGNAEFSWNLGGAELTQGTSLLFEGTTLGAQPLVFRVKAENGTAEKEFTVTVLKKPVTNTLFYFDYGKWRNDSTSPVGTYTVPKGRKLVICPVRHYRQLTDTAAYEWALDGVIQRQDQVFPCYFTFDVADEEAGAEHTVTVYARDKNRYGSFEAAAETKIRIVESEGSYRRPVNSGSSPRATRVLEFTPAPGQFVTENSFGYPPVAIAPGRSEEEIASETEAYMLSDAICPPGLEGGISLGAWGGYVVTGFDHSIDNIPGGYSFSIEGNPLGDFWCEPGIVWVSQDENGNGKADDTWFELRGSETGREGTVQLYSVTYHKPDTAKGCVWEDNMGETGALPYSFSGRIMGYPYHTGGDSVTFTGTVLQPHLFISVLISHYSYPYGYVDNVNSTGQSDNFRIANFKISDAMQVDGTPVYLAYIDFVKVQCAVNEWAGGLGEISTEMGLPVDYRMTH
jgi:hypothetical protein